MTPQSLHFLKLYLKLTSARFQPFSQGKYIVNNGWASRNPNELHGASFEIVNDDGYYGFANGCCAGLAVAYLLAMQDELELELNIYFDSPKIKSIIRGVMNAQHARRVQFMQFYSLGNGQASDGKVFLNGDRGALMALFFSVERGHEYRALSVGCIRSDAFQLEKLSPRGRDLYEILLTSVDYGHAVAMKATDRNYCFFEILLTSVDYGHVVAMKVTDRHYCFFDPNLGQIIYPRTQYGHALMETALKMIFEDYYYNDGYNRLTIIQYIEVGDASN